MKKRVKEKGRENSNTRTLKTADKPFCGLFVYSFASLQPHVCLQKSRSYEDVVSHLERHMFKLWDS